MTSRRTTVLVALVLAAAAAGAAVLGLFRGRRGARTVVLITVDTLRRDHVSAYGGDAASTPRIDELAHGGTRFECRTPAPLTLPAHVTMLSGLPPAVHGVRSNSASGVPPAAARAWRLVAERMSEAGRCSGAFVSAGPLVAAYGLDRGFEAYDDGGFTDRTGLGYEERVGTETVAKALAWLRGLPEDAPAFLWVHLFEPHHPYRGGSYVADVEAADAAVGALLDGLRAAGRGDAAICLASDHGEALGERGERTHGVLLVEGVMRVPLVVRAEGVPAGAVREDPADLADVAPILLHLAGLPTDVAGGGGPGTGIDLLAGPAPADRPRVSEALFANHQFAWAQLSGAVVGPWKVEDAGEDPREPGARLRLFRLDDRGKEGGTPWPEVGVPAADRPEAVAPLDALRAYRRSEDRTAGEGGTAAGGYGAGGAVAPFLEPADNGRLPYPYERIEDLTRFYAAVASYRRDAPPRALEALLGELRRLETLDPGNPTLPFWRGRVEFALGRPAAASRAFVTALERGRRDAQTLILAVGAAADPPPPSEGADVRAKAALALLDTWLPLVPRDARIHDLEARLAAAAEDPARAARATAEGARLKAAAAAARSTSPAPEGCR